MKVIKTASGKKTIKMSKVEWQSIGKKAGWMKTANVAQDPDVEAKPFYDYINNAIQNGQLSGAGLSTLVQNLTSLSDSYDVQNPAAVAPEEQAAAPVGSAFTQ